MARAARSKSRSKSTGRAKPPAELVRAFAERGYVRVRAPRVTDRGMTSHKGYEVRIPVRDTATAKRLARMIREVGFKPGKPYATGTRIVVPVYGREAVESFARWVKRINREKAERIEKKLATGIRPA